METSEEDPMGHALQAYLESAPLIDRMAKNAGLPRFEREDLLQRVAVVLAEKAADYDPARGTHRMWALGIARNILLDVLRTLRVEKARRASARSLDQVPSPDLTPEQALRARESIALLVGAVREEHRAVLELDALDYSAAEIGALLGISVPHAEWRLREARKDLDRALRTMGEDRRSATRVRAVPIPLAVFSNEAPANAPFGAVVRLVATGVGAAVWPLVAAVAALWLSGGSPSAATVTAHTRASAAPTSSLSAVPARDVDDGDLDRDGEAPLERAPDRLAIAEARVGGDTRGPSAPGPMDERLRPVGRHRWMWPMAVLSLSSDRRSNSLRSGVAAQRPERDPLGRWVEGTSPRGAFPSPRRAPHDALSAASGREATPLRSSPRDPGTRALVLK